MATTGSRLGSGSSYRSRSSSYGSYDFQTVLIPEERTMKIIVITTSEYELELVRMLVEELDTEMTAARRKTHIYQVKYLTAPDVADVLSSLIEGTRRTGGLTGRTSGTRTATTRRTSTMRSAATTPGATPTTAGGTTGATGGVTSGETRIVPHEQTNSLLIQADPDEFEEILFILNTIDRKRNQVFLESALVQVSEKSDLNFTIELLAGSLRLRLHETQRHLGLLSAAALQRLKRHGSEQGHDPAAHGPSHGFPSASQDRAGQCPQAAQG